MSFCKKRLQPFLPFTNHLSCPPSLPPASKCLPVASGIGLLTATEDTSRPPNVLEPASVRRPPPPPLPTRPPGEAPAAGFFNDVGEIVDGLTSCTESLGFESPDEWGVHERSKSDPGDGTGEHEPMPCTLWRRKRMGEIERIRERKFPPPLTSLNDKGRPSYFLKPVRRDGRLEVSTGRLETLRASRIDGRLRLDFIKDPEFEADNRETTADDVVDEMYEAEEEEQMVVISRETLGGVTRQRWRPAAVATATARRGNTTCTCGGNVV